MHMVLRQTTAVLFAFITCAAATGCAANAQTAPQETATQETAQQETATQWSSRPAELIAQITAENLRTTLEACAASSPQKSEFSIGHRGAPLRFPEHTREGYIEAAKTGAGLLECDVTFTADKALVCRHSQCDLHSTTNILHTPLAAACSNPPDANSRTPYKNVKCCTSDLTLSEFKSLKGKVDYGNKKAKTLNEYHSLAATPKADLQKATGTLMTHSESIELFRALGVKMIPELKAPQVDMPYQSSFTQEKYAQKLVDEYVAAKIDPASVFLQSFSLDDVQYWLQNAPSFGKQATWLDGRYRDRRFDPTDDQTWIPSMTELAQSGVKILAPPLWMLLTLDSDKQIVPSKYATAATAAGLEIIPWTLERSGSLSNGGGWYYQSIKSAISNDGDIYSVLDILARKIKVRGVFSDWPETVTYYANCFGID